MDQRPWRLKLADKRDVDRWRIFIVGYFGSSVCLVDPSFHHPPDDPEAGMYFGRKAWIAIFKSPRYMQHDDPEVIAHAVRCMTQALVDYLAFFYKVDHEYVCDYLLHPPPEPLPRSLWNLFQVRWYKSQFADQIRSYRARARTCRKDYHSALQAFGLDQLRESLTNRPDCGGPRVWEHFVMHLSEHLSGEPDPFGRIAISIDPVI
ncbi:hypothetical protein CALVIDRAFT_562003 [Calocera viscosa TUFC12733]|uniref:Uncharacterized protein n=1 Tax=Calocera viscosa (strain TUFC12733) TaxID=1330018 RepID=A0A167P9F1_CALVF|nr:hypothetical protein CALVIDRAFT_562003 [Calocera viscosa TUFC12733]